MTRRILLTLAEDTTATECGGCEHRSINETDYGDYVWCDVYGETRGGARHAKCLAAERAAERMVEIAPEDANYTAPMLRTFASDEEHRVKAALIEHGRKAVRDDD